MFRVGRLLAVTVTPRFAGPGAAPAMLGSGLAPPPPGLLGLEAPELAPSPRLAICRTGGGR
jgi:hypothetical protein